MGAGPPEPPPDVFSNLTPGADSMLTPLENIQTDPTALRALTAKLDLLSMEVGQTWRHGVELLLSQPPGPRDAIQKLQTYFQIAPDLKVQISGIDVLRQGDQAAATFTRRDEFTDAKTGKKVHLEVTTTGMLRKEPDGDWKIVGLRGPQ